MKVDILFEVGTFRYDNLVIPYRMFTVLHPTFKVKFVQDVFFLSITEMTLLEVLSILEYNRFV